jgi:hypothetical protein
MTLAPFFSAGIKVSQDLDTVLVRPVVEDRSEEVHVCILDGLWREKSWFMYVILSLSSGGKVSLPAAAVSSRS